MLNRKYYVMLQSFQDLYSVTASKAVDWYPSGRNEITVVLNDGTRVVFNELHGTCRQVRTVDVDHMDERTLRNMFSRTLTRKLRDKHMSANQLSDATGISYPSIHNYVTGKSLPNVYYITLIARVLECSPTELMECIECLDEE